MLTVLIQNQQTMDSFYEYLPFFSDAQNTEELSLCLWNEQGMTIEESLPDLHRLTDSKKSWRAVIVRYQDGPYLKRLPTALDNPYDFDDSDNPLARLCRQLSPSIEYFSRHRIGHPQDNRFEGILPDSITLITVRNIDGLAAAPQDLIWIEKSDFVDRNLYPSRCRFTVADRVANGPFQKIRDDIHFWNLVLLLAFTPLDSSFLQAYTLHGLSCSIDKQTMEQVWNEKFRQLEQTKKQVERYLMNQSVYLEENDSHYPRYRSTERSFFLDESVQREHYPVSQYLHLSSDPEELYEKWMNNTAEEQKNVLDDWKSFPDQVQERVPSLQRRSGYDMKDVFILSSQKQTKLENEVNDLRKELIGQQRNLPEITNSQKEELEAARIEAGMQILNQPSRKKVFIWTASMTGICFLSSIPGWVSILYSHEPGFWLVLMLTFTTVLVPVVSIGWVMYKERKKVRKAIEKWNTRLSDQYQTLFKFMTQYANYLDDVLSYRAGRSYLEQMDLKIKKREREIGNLESFRDDLNRFQKMLERWAQALDIHLSAGYESEKPMNAKVLFDPAYQQKQFLFEKDTSCECEINDTGKLIRSTFPFISGLQIWKIGERKRS